MMQLWVIMGKPQRFCALEGKRMIIIQFLTEVSYLNQLTKPSATSPAETPLLERLKAGLGAVPLLWSNYQVTCQLNVQWIQPQNIHLDWPQLAENLLSIWLLTHPPTIKCVSDVYFIQSKPTPKRHLYQLSSWLSKEIVILIPKETFYQCDEITLW